MFYFNGCNRPESSGLKTQSKGSKFSMLSFSQNKLWILITRTDARGFCYLSYLISTNFMTITQEILFYFFWVFCSTLSAWKLTQERHLGEQTSAHVLMLLGEGDGGCEVEKNTVVVLSLSDFFGTRTGSSPRVFQYKMFHFSLNRYLEKAIPWIWLSQSERNTPLSMAVSGSTQIPCPFCVFQAHCAQDSISFLSPL